MHKKVIQKTRTDTLEDVKKQFPNDRVIESDAVCGQIENDDGSFSNPPPPEKSDEEKRIRQDYKDAFNALTDENLKTVLRPLIKEALESEA